MDSVLVNHAKEIANSAWLAGKIRPVLSGLNNKELLESLDGTILRREENGKYIFDHRAICDYLVRVPNGFTQAKVTLNPDNRDDVKLFCRYASMHDYFLKTFDELNNMTGGRLHQEYMDSSSPDGSQTIPVDILVEICKGSKLIGTLDTILFGVKRFQGINVDYEGKPRDLVVPNIPGIMPRTENLYNIPQIRMLCEQNNQKIFSWLVLNTHSLTHDVKPNDTIGNPDLVYNAARLL